MPDRPPIPPRLWARVLAFLATEASGTVTLHVTRGRVILATVQLAAPPTARRASRGLRLRVRGVLKSR